MIEKLNELQLRIMAELEEAGEQEVAGLLITIANEPDTLNHFVDAVSGLQKMGLVNVSADLDPASLKWKILASSEEARVIESLRASLAWSGEKQAWVWIAPEPSVTLVTTEKGVSISIAILRKKGYGWYLKKRDR